jgi:uncharacterized protein YecA (UPF0149 family)
MAEGYLANNKKTPQGVANVEVILFNHLMQKGWKEQTEQWKEQTEQWKGLYSLLNGKPKDLQLKDYCHELC